MNLYNSPKSLDNCETNFKGAILLDVENFPFSLDLEKHLKSYCRYPITLKLAVANWQNNSVSKLDNNLHQQGYQLIHVPKGNNAADGQIITLGSSLLLQYPSIRDVIIVSQDKIFNYLHQILRAHGCNTYKVYNQSKNIYCYDSYQGISSLMLKLESNSSFNSNPQKILHNKITKVVNKLTKESNKSVTLSQLSQQFKLDYNQSINEVVKQNKLAKSASNFMQASCPNTINCHQENGVYYFSSQNK